MRLFWDLCKACTENAPRSQYPRTMSSSDADRRLLKEFKQLSKSPVPKIRAHPDSENILVWHFVLFGDGVYEGGEYYGQILFPSQYPFKPPDMKMLTPNGRFEQNRTVCMSITGYHPESWNPSWSVSTLLLGLQSFFYEESNGLGSLKLSDEQRRKYAQQSVSFNNTNPEIKNILRDMFPDLLRDVASSGKKRERSVERPDDEDNKKHKQEQVKPANVPKAGPVHDDKLKQPDADTYTANHTDTKEIEIIEILD